ncbi:MAG: hypothetical protein H6707_10305 [Deltaproteobacteria bacterium]|nr:hypothetical protein [Deltaproteobacteria bacterium]
MSTSRLRRVSSVAWWAIGALGLIGCAGALEDQELFISARYQGADGGADAKAADSTPTNAAAIAVLTARCARCHVKGGSGLLDLMSSGVVGRLLDQRSTICPDKVLVDAKDPAQGLFAEKLAAAPSCGVSMPFEQPLLEQSEVSVLIDWLRAMVKK